MKASLFLVLGLRRSGNHAVFNWMIPQMRGKVRILNDHLLDEVTSGKRPFYEARSTHHYFNPEGRPYALVDAGHREMIQEVCWNALLKQLGWWGKRSVRGVDPYAARAEQHIPFAIKDTAGFSCDWNVVGLENYTPEQAARQWRDLLASGPGQAVPFLRDALRIVVIVRNPFNMLASVLKGLKEPVHPNHLRLVEAGAAWTAYAREALGETQYLAGLGTVVPLFYDRWFADAAYRAELADRLGLEHDDSGLGEMSVNGMGSSFEGLSQSDPRKLNVLERWKAYRGNPEYCQALSQPDLLRLHRVLFGEPPFVP